jgi:transformation/transcription domain-associated protein
VKICEQAKAYLEMKGELVNGLNLINNTNLEFFPVKNKAEIFRLRGDFLLKMNDCETANQSYSNAITLFKHLPKGWISWGNYCDMVCLQSFLSSITPLQISTLIDLSLIIVLFADF